MRIAVIALFVAALFAGLAPSPVQATCTATAPCQASCDLDIICPAPYRPCELMCFKPGTSVTCNGASVCSVGAGSVTCDGTTTNCPAPFTCRQTSTSVQCGSTLKTCAGAGNCPL